MWGCFEPALRASGGEGADFDSPQSARPHLRQQPALPRAGLNHGAQPTRRARESHPKTLAVNS